MAPIRIATRSSPQATTQSRTVADHLVARGHDVELVHVDTHGDRTQAHRVPLHSIGGQGVFVKEVQRAVLDGRADLAVHSAKDLPTVTEAGLVIGAYTARRSVGDALIGRSLADLAPGATVATGSVRRRAQLRRARPDLDFAELRGNIHTRLDRIPDAGAIVMAIAALEVLDLTDRVAEALDPTEFVPAVGQGCVAVECRSDDDDLIDVLRSVDDRPTRRAVEIERAFLGELGSGCSLPVGAWCDGKRLHTFLAGDRHTVSDSVALGSDEVADTALAVQVARSALAAVT